MSFGAPSKHGGKFYAGRSDDTPVNHDLLWRARVSSELHLLDSGSSRAAPESSPLAYDAPPSPPRAPPQYGNGGEYGEEIALRAMLRDARSRTEKQERKLRLARNARLDAEKQVALELRRTRHLKMELDLAKSGKLSPTTSPAISPVSKARARRRQRNSPFKRAGGASLSPSRAPAVSASQSPKPLIVRERNVNSAVEAERTRKHIQNISYLCQ